MPDTLPLQYPDGTSVSAISFSGYHDFEGARPRGLLIEYKPNEGTKRHRYYVADEDQEPSDDPELNANNLPFTMIYEHKLLALGLTYGEEPDTPPRRVRLRVKNVEEDVFGGYYVLDPNPPIEYQP